MDPIELITEDHRKVEALFKEYESLGERAYQHKRALVDSIIEELTAHAEMEEGIAYPAFKDAFTNEDDKMVAEAYAEHEVAKQLMNDLQNLSPEDEQFDAKVKVLKENIEHHVEEEERDLLPQARGQLSADELERIAAEMQAFKDARLDDEF